jgi:hypothetical protein
MTVRRFFKLVTWTNVPKGSERCAGGSFDGENNSPLPVLPPFCEQIAAKECLSLAVACNGFVGASYKASSGVAWQCGDIDGRAH